MMGSVNPDARATWMGSSGVRRSVSLMVALVLGWPGVTRAADSLVPGAVQAAMMVRILEYDRSLTTRASGTISVGVVARDTSATSVSEFRQALSGRDAQGIRIQVAEHPYRDADTLIRWMERAGLALLYVSADLGTDARSVIAAATARGLATLTATRKHFDAGGTLGIVVRDEKPHILIDLASSRTAGMDLDPKLLALAEVKR